MKQTKLLRVLQTFSNKERKGFSKHVHNPYFNENERLIALYQIIDEHFFQLKTEPSKEYVWEQLFPKRKFNDAILRKNISDLSKLAEDFLVWQRVSLDQVQHDILLLKEYNKRKLDKDFSQILKTVKQQQRTQPHRDSQFYYNQHVIASELNRYVERSFKRTKEVNLREAVKHLDHYYLINKLKYCCDFLNYKNVIDIEVDLLLMDEILKHLRENEYTEVPAIAIYYHILMMFMEDDKDHHFDILTGLLAEHSLKFTQYEQLGLYIYAINFCIKKANTGDRKYLLALFNLYKQALEKGIFFEGKYISPWSYKNIVTAGLRVGETDWTRNFIHEYKSRIDKPFRDNAFTYNLARFHFHLKAYDEVISLLAQVEYEDIFYNIDAKSLLLKTYFETEEVNALFSLCDSFEIFLRRNKLISEYHRSNYLNMIRFIRKMIRLKPGDQEKRSSLEEQIKEAKQVSDRKWLLAQLG